jgi:hypothetical protein
MSRYSPYFRRLQRLEPEPEYIDPWPPKPGTMGHLLYQDIGQPAERMGFREMYLLAAERFYEA